jgi:predicted transcriptional regulator
MGMSLKLPSEIVAEQVLSTLRVRLARELADRGFTQQQVADRFGVTQAAVSQYVSEENSVVARIDEHPQTRQTVARIAEGFDEKEMDGDEALDELLSLIRAFEDGGPICELHEEAMPALEGLGCDLCMRGTDEQLATDGRSSRTFGRWRDSSRPRLAWPSTSRTSAPTSVTACPTRRNRPTSRRFRAGCTR